MENVEIPKWLKGLPSAPEFYPTDTEFADPIAYISKIEKEASAYGICKVIPPFPKPSRKYVLYNLNKSLLKRPELGSDINLRPVSGNMGNDGEARAVFTTRQQELGQSTKKTKGAGNSQQPTAQKQVWQSGEIYTLEQFESKSKMFSRSVLSTVKEVSQVATEAFFWKAASDKPIYVEYANDVPGSAFGEANGLLNYLHGSKRRRRRIFSRDNARRSDCRQEMPSNTKDVCGEETYTSSHHLWNPSSISDIGSANPSKSSIDCTLQLPNQSASYPRHEMEGTAGWKLSNSPWNLQVIARSAGSLTRFILDDVPGVTSPMIYIGMLFSWFAWHVEDHELHSLNFLHMGSPKTWYAVPADHAYAFEEVVRKHAYGGDFDRLATLTRLGEKTTLLSPEVVAASSIPCYRLVQNPGEFVVTFPRAYHMGFSHGFNCGEAANFGTPHWLEVAKEAAVRRAAMDHLPMLSHQQLLYLLTMSFVSRVPSSLLPGVRSSRLRDRLKEERELSVKKAFIEDMLKENKMLNILLRRDSAFYAVLWNPDLLPSNKGSMQHTEIATDISTHRKDEVSMLLKDDGHSNLSNQTNLYMKNMNDLYFGDSDLSSNFQVDSGTLACVACGILGFPFMSLIQPSNKASKAILSADNHLCGGGAEASRHVKSGSSNDCNIHKVLTSGEVIKFDERWNTSCGFYRPRSFCLEHAVQVQALLQPKGGANVLVICHSDYEKMKGNAIALAQEIGCTFNYKEVMLGSAAVEDLNLINLAIDDEELNDCKEDWTTNLGINLRYCVKTRKDSPLKQIQHALKLVGLFSDASTSSISDIQWYSRKFRSKRAFVPQKLGKSWESLYVKDKNVEGRLIDSITGRGKIVLQYSRRKFKRMQVGSAEASGAIGSSMKHPAEIIAANSGNICGILEDGLESVNTDAVSTEVALSASAQINLQPEIGRPKACRRPGQESGYRESKTRKEALEEMKVEVHACTSTISEFSQDNKFNAESSKNNGISHTNHSSCSPAVTTDKSNMDEEADVTDEENSLDEVGREGTPSSSSGESIRPADDASDSGDLTTTCPCEDVGDLISEKPYMLLGVPDPVASDNQFRQRTEGQLKEKEVASSCCKHGNECTTNDGGQSNIKAHTRQVDRKSAYDSSILADAKITRNPSKRKRKSVFQIENQFICEGGYVRSPCEGLRPRSKKEKATSKITLDHEMNRKFAEKVKKPSGRSLSKVVVLSERSYKCNLDGCRMSFKTRTDLSLHMRNRCPYEECGKKFSNHRYAMLHQRVHDKERPLKCAWKGCSMTFKWAWARTEHMRLHTGERPYECKIEGCGLTFRYVSDFSRHRRKTGHYVNPCS